MHSRFQARRAGLERRPSSVVNRGIGMPESVASVAAQEKIIDLVTRTAEPGAAGGIPASGMGFAAATDAQADAQGTLNVGKRGPRLAWAGGIGRARARG